MAKSFSLILTAPGGDPVHYRLTDDRITFGRAEANRIVVGEKAISSRHARFVKSAKGGYSLADLGSTNGTRVNGQKVMDPAGVALKHGDRLLFGETVEGQFFEVVEGQITRQSPRNRPVVQPVMVSASEIEGAGSWIPVPNWLAPSDEDHEDNEAINPVAAAVARQSGEAVRRS